MHVFVDVITSAPVTCDVTNNPFSAQFTISGASVRSIDCVGRRCTVEVVIVTRSSPFDDRIGDFKAVCCHLGTFSSSKMSGHSSRKDKESYIRIG